MPDQIPMTVEEGKSAIIEQMHKHENMPEFVEACQCVLQILDRIDVPLASRVAFLEKRNDQLEGVLNDITGRVRYAHIGDSELTIRGIRRLLERHTQRTFPYIPPLPPPIPEGAKGYLHAWRDDEYDGCPMWCWLDVHSSVYTQHDQGIDPKPMFRYYGSFVTRELLRLARKTEHKGGQNE